MLCFFGDLTRYMKLRGLGVEVGAADADKEGGVNAGRRGGAGSRFSGYAADGGGAEEI